MCQSKSQLSFHPQSHQRNSESNYCAPLSQCFRISLASLYHFYMWTEWNLCRNHRRYSHANSIFWSMQIFHSNCPDYPVWPWTHSSKSFSLLRHCDSSAQLLPIRHHHSIALKAYCWSLSRKLSWIYSPDTVHGIYLQEEINLSNQRISISQNYTNWIITRMEYGAVCGNSIIHEFADRIK